MCATQRQKVAFSKTMEKNGNVSRSMREAGYSPNTAKTPKAITESKGWQELMEQYMPDDLLAQKHNELLNKKEVVIKTNSKGKFEVVETGQLETHAVRSALDMGYKLKGRYAPEKLKIMDLNDDLSDEQLEEETNRREGLRKLKEKPQA